MTTEDKLKSALMRKEIIELKAMVLAYQMRDEEAKIAALSSQAQAEQKAAAQDAEK